MTTYDPFAPWNTPGWTPFNGVALVAQPQGVTVAPKEWPADLALVTVTREYLDPNGYPQVGIVRFTRLVPLTLLGVTIQPGQIVGTVDSGNLSVELPASNDPDADAPFIYHVKECFPGGREFSVIIPYDQTTVDLYDCITTETDETVVANDPGIQATLAFEQGQTFTRDFQYQDSNGNPVGGLTGYTATLQVRPSRSSSTLTLSKTLTWDAATATASLTLSSVETAALAVGRYVYGIELSSADTPPIVIPLITFAGLVVSEAVVR